MEDVLDALTTRRVRVLQRLLEGGASQAELARWLAGAEGIGSINPGVMPQILAPLFRLQLITRPRARGEITLTRPHEIRGLLVAANALAGQAAIDGRGAMRRAGREAKRTAKTLELADGKQPIGDKPSQP